MSTAVINIKIESGVKAKAKKVAEELGFNLSAVLNGYLRQFVRTKRINFSLEEPSERLIKAMKKGKLDWKSGKGSPVFKNSHETNKWLEEQGI